MVGTQALLLCQPSAVQSLTRELRAPAAGAATRRSLLVSPWLKGSHSRLRVSVKRQGSTAKPKVAGARAAVSPATTTIVKEVPGSWDEPGFSVDYDDIYFDKGWYEFYTSRQKRFGNVFRANVGPSAEEARFIVLLDQTAFPVLYDLTKVSKVDTFYGDYMADLNVFTGGQRVCAYMDPSEDLHTRIKSYCMALLAKYGPRHLTTNKALFDELFKSWEAAIEKDGKVEVCAPLLQFMWDWHMSAFEGPVGWKEGSAYANDWAGAALLPVVSLPFPPKIEKVAKPLLLPLITKAKKPQEKFNEMKERFKKEMTEAVKLGTSAPSNLTEDQAAMNLVFFIAFNSRNALASSFSNAVIEFGLADAKTKADMVAEVEAALKKTGGELTFQAINDMPLLESFVYEVFRMHPPVSAQHGVVKEDMVLESNTGRYQLRKGDKLLGQCFFASRDPAVFENADKFNARRFLGEGKAKIKNVIWSNGFQSTPAQETLNLKQCPGKDLVPLLVRVFMARFLTKYKDVQFTGKGGLLSNITSIFKEEDLSESVGWSTTKIVPGPMLKIYGPNGPELYVKSLVKK